MEESLFAKMINNHGGGPTSEKGRVWFEFDGAWNMESLGKEKELRSGQLTVV